MPLGQGYTAEEQVTGAAEHGGIQLLVRPLRREVWARRLEQQRQARASWTGDGVLGEACASPSAGMGLAPGGGIRQLDFPPWSGGMRSERHPAAGMVIPSMLVRASAGVR